MEGSIKSYENLISKLEGERDRLATNGRAYETYTKQIEDTKQALVNLRIEFEGLESISNIGSLEDSFERINEILTGPKTLEGFDYDKANEELQEWSDRFSEAEKKRREEAKRTAELRQQLEQETYEVQREAIFQSIELVNTVFDAKVQRYEDDIRRNSEYYDTLLANEALTEEQRLALEAERLRKEKELDKKKRKEERKQAIFNKIAALAEIAINTALAVTKVTAQAGVLAPALIPSIIALGALQAATVASTPIPQYRHGRKNGKEEIAYVGDGGRSEIIKNPDGSAYITPNRPTLTLLKKDAEVIPDAKKYLDSVGDENLINDLSKHTYLATLAGQSDRMDKWLYMKEINGTYKTQTDRIISTLNGKRTQFRLNQNINIGKDLKFLGRLNDAL